ncbi:hypothetical protein QR680_018163 [Steinernema hermaphroditum]|uniref:Uncharacterized protein n=1 Tax=Steinernema hermaphroditum TaxID=289476 RepID=A0AA39HH32_9BILA|nr:hypothetical protein QR680_018163 [Steinernema hermaphroditum]
MASPPTTTFGAFVKECESCDCNCGSDICSCGCYCLCCCRCDCDRQCVCSCKCRRFYNDENGDNQEEENFVDYEEPNGEQICADPDCPCTAWNYSDDRFDDEAEYEGEWQRLSDNPSECNCDCSCCHSEEEGDREEEEEESSEKEECSCSDSEECSCSDSEECSCSDSEECSECECSYWENSSEDDSESDDCDDSEEAREGLKSDRSTVDSDSSEPCANSEDEFKYDIVISAAFGSDESSAESSEEGAEAAKESCDSSEPQCRHSKEEDSEDDRFVNMNCFEVPVLYDEIGELKKTVAAGQEEVRQLRAEVGRLRAALEMRHQEEEIVGFGIGDMVGVVMWTAFDTVFYFLLFLTLVLIMF